MSEQPLMIDLFAGLGGWAEGGLAEGFRMIGYDIEAHVYGHLRYPGELVLQDVLTIHGSQFKDASLIVASPPCQSFSYMAMPWSKAKAIQAEYLSGKRDVKELTALFDACFRIQREASEAAGRYIPMVVENVRGAEKWVGKARWAWGSFLLWGDVPALMPITQPRHKGRSNFHQQNGLPSPPFHGAPHERSVLRYEHFKSQGLNWSDQTKKGQDFTRRAAEHCGQKPFSPAWQAKHYEENAKMQTDGRKQPGISGRRTNGKGDKWFQDGAARSGSKSNARKAASALIAKIPFVLASWIAKTYYPR